MDFSSVPRALDSLQRRHPPLDDTILVVCRSLIQSQGNLLTSQQVCDALTTLLQYDNDAAKDGRRPRWEPLAAGLYVSTYILERASINLQSSETKEEGAGEGIVYMEGPRVPLSVECGDAPTWTCPELSTDQILNLCEILHPLSLVNLEHHEPRLRTLVAKAAGAYCKATVLMGKGEAMRRNVHTRVTSSIEAHLVEGRRHAEQAESNYSRSSNGALDDTTGWRALETNWQCLAAIVSAMGPKYFDDFGPFSDELLNNCEYSSIQHPNRHVRAAGMAVLEQCILAATQSTVHTQSLLTDYQSGFCKTMTAVLRDGLADNWSQVRMAASVLCRCFLTSLQAMDADLTPLFPALLPRMCLNRFYLAQGVKLYSYETWKILFQNNPQSSFRHVSENLPSVCRYYVKCCDADNHVVREAACQAIAELAAHLGKSKDYHDVLQSQVDLLMQALLMCFHDESWPVRDEACLGCGILCKAYPEECRPELGTLWQRWTEQLTDQIWSVRKDAAVALGDAMEAYGQEFYQKIKVLVNDLLPSAKKQAPMTREEFKARQNDAAAHTDSQLFSCGSLAPKLKKRKDGAGRIGCSSCDVTRERQLWEATDGCIYLVAELVKRCTAEDSVVSLTDAEIRGYMEQLIDVCRVQHFPQADDLRATLWGQVPIMAEALGKQRFKRNGYLEIFTDLLFSNLESRTASQLSKHAAGQCAEDCADLIGVAIFRGRLEDYQRDIFDDAMREREAMPKGPAMGGPSFSPFGPQGLVGQMGL